jgi:TonB-linked SusC/RagA family outer membrane protein
MRTSVVTSFERTARVLLLAISLLFIFQNPAIAKMPIYELGLISDNNPEHITYAELEHIANDNLEHVANDNLEHVANDNLEHVESNDHDKESNEHDRVRNDHDTERNTHDKENHHHDKINHNLIDGVLRVINGKVIDENGKPVEGASVRVKDLKTGTSSNAAGAFALDVPDNATVVISSVGYETKEVLITDDKDLIITLKSTGETMQDAVVVGYSSKKAKYLSSSVSVISGEKLRDVTSNELSSLLQGKAPGVVVSSGSGDPTSGSNILIRGAGTISAGSGPLIVVDGNIGGSYNPNDVESISILKDAAATGLYGSRAGNGVIIVTTKTGKAGKTRIDFNSAVGFNKESKGNFELMNTQQLYDYHKTFYNPDPAALNTNTDWWDLAFRDAMTQTYTLSVSGGNERTQFYASGNYYKEEGTLDKNDKSSYSFRTNFTHRISDKLKLGVLFNGNYIKDNYNPAGTLYEAYTNMPFDSAYNADGSPRDPRTGNWFGRDRNNFLHSLQYDMSNAATNRVSGDINLDYVISKHFSFATYNRGTFTNYRSATFYDKRSKSGATNGGELYNSTSYTSVLTSSNRLRYDNNFGAHNLSVLAVGEVTQSYYDVNSIAVKGLPPGRPFASTATDVISNPTGGKNEYSFQKYLAQADYNYANKYFAVASFVRDRSSRFGNNNSTANFYQLGASWVISNEAFMSSIKAINFLKLRASYGSTGNAEIGDYAALGLYTISTSASYANAPGAAPSQKGNPDLTWEKQQTTNIGLDISFFKRIDLTVDVYEKIATDLLYQKPLPATSGYSFIWENIGSVRNRGLEFNLTTRNVVTKEFHWETNLNMAFNRNKVIELNDGALFSSPGATQPVGIGHDIDEWNMPVWSGVDPANGDPLWEKVIKDGDAKKYITYTNDYNSVATADSRQYLGQSAAPKFTGGITNTISYKGFSLSAFLNFVYGNYVYNDTRFYFDNDGVYEKYNSMVLAPGWNRWEKAGDIATHPKPYFGGNKSSNATSTRYLEDGSYIRLRNVTIGYDLPVSVINRIKLNRARLYVSGDNLWTGTNFSGPDPEVVLSSGTSSFRYPISRKILFGVNLSF